MNIHSISHHNDNKKHMEFILTSIQLPYLNGVRRCILGEYTSYAVDHIEYVENTSRINNDKLTTKMSLLPVSQPMGFSVTYMNNELVPMDVTTDDLKLYRLDDPWFHTHMETSFVKKQRVTDENQRKIVTNNYVKSIKTHVPYVMNQRIKEYLDSDDSKCQDDPVIPPDIHLISLMPGECIDMYGITFPGSSKKHIKWQQANAYFRQCKDVVQHPDLDWDTYIKNIIERIADLDENGYKQDKVLVDKVLYATNNYETYKTVEWTDEFKLKIYTQIDCMIHQECHDVYTKDIDSYKKYNRCVPCIQKISYLLNVPSDKLYSTVLRDEYLVTIKSNTINPKRVWNKSVKYLKHKLELFFKNIEEIVKTHLRPHEKMENGYYIKLENHTHTLGNILQHELQQQKKLFSASYILEHPLHTYVSMVLKWKKPVDDPVDAATDIFKVAITKSINYMATVPLFDKIE
jgi:DNA-directed RNA polymerase subunit L